MTRKARVGVIGAGWWAAVNHLPAQKANPDCEVVAVNRLGAPELAELKRIFEAPLGFEDYRVMLDQVPMDGVVISSPHVLHHEQGGRSARQGLKAVHQIDGRPAIRQLTARRLADVRVHECWGGPSTVELRPNAQAPIHRLPVVDMLDGLYWRADFTLVPGRVIRDYLAPKT